MKIAFVSYTDAALPKVDSDGGAIALRYLAKGLASRGHILTLFTNRVINPDPREKYLWRKAKAQKTNRESWGSRITIVRKPMKFIGSDINLIIEKPFFSRIVDSLTFGSCFNDLEFKDFDIVFCFHPTSAFGFLTYQFPCPVFFFPMLLSSEYEKYLPVSQIYKDFEKKLLEKVDYICTISKAEQRAAVQIGIKRSKTLVIPLGFNPDHFPFQARLAIPRTHLVTIACVGEIRKQKNQLALLPVAQILREKGFAFKFLIIGKRKGQRNLVSSRYSDVFEKETKRLGLENFFEFAGSVDQDKVSDLLSKSDMAIFPSLGESYGQAALECIASGLPTILCKDIDAYKEFANSRNVFLTGRTSKEMARAILTLAKNDRLYARLSAAGKKLRGRFAWKKVIANLEGAIKNVLK